MTKFYRMLELRDGPAEAKAMGRQSPGVLELQGYPSLYWLENEAWRMWPKPNDGIEVLYNQFGRPVGWVIED